MKKDIVSIYSLLFVFAVGLIAGEVSAFEINSRYAAIIYNSYNELDDFNNEIFLGKYNYLLKNENITTLEDEVAFKIDLIVDRVKSILNMHPSDVKFKMAICGSEKELQRAYEAIYKKPTNFIAFYSPRINTVYFSVSDVEFQTIAHEFAHIITEHYFKVSPPVKIHELIADYAEETIIE